MSFYQEPTLSASLSRASRAAFKYVPLFLLSFAMIATGFAQSTGSIRGKVQNASTGKYLTNASVSIQGTNKSTTTDEYGVYRFNDIATGEYTIEASFIGLKTASVKVSVDTGISSGADIVLRSSQFASGDEEVFELEAFEVGGSDYNSNAIAQNERKMSSSLKLVQDAEALGEIAEGNIGEFLKNLPGVSIDYVAADARSIKLRGMGSEFTQVTVDGAQMASAGSSGAIRNFELEQVSLSNVEHLEVTKLPRADMPANSLGGSVNLVSKNAFAQGGRQITYKAYLTFNDSQGFDLGKSPGWMSSQSKHKTTPGFELSYSDVLIEDKLGASFTFSQSNQFNIQHRVQLNGTYRTLSDGTIMNDRLAVQDGPKFTFRQSVAANFDYKLSDSTIFTLRTQGNEYNSEFGNKNYNYRIDTNATTIAASSDGHMEGTPNNGGINIGGSNRNKFGTTYHVDLGAKHTFGDWKVDYGFWKSEATNHYGDVANGYVEGISTKNFATNSGTKRVTFESDSVLSPLVVVRAYDAAGKEIPNSGINLEDGQLSYLRSRPNDSVDRIDGIRFNANYDFEVGESKGTFKFGYQRNAQAREANQREFRYEVKAGTGAINQRLDAFLDTTYVGISPGFGYPALEWPSFHLLNDYLENNPGNFTYNATQNLTNQTARYFELKETVTAYYGMGQLSFNGRKGLVTAGVRIEDTDLIGQTARDRVQLPDKSYEYYVSLDQNDWITGEFIESKNAYSTTHPSLHVRYNFTDKLVGRIGYADTIGRANFGNMYGPVTVQSPFDDDGTEVGNYTVKLKNPLLRPRRSDDIDATIEYYFGDTSLLSASVFSKKIKDFEGNDTVDMTPELLAKLGINLPTPSGGFDAGLDTISTVRNVGDAKVEGLELSWNQSLDLDFIPESLRGSSLYWNGTFLDLEGNFAGSSYSADVFKDNFPGFAKKTVSYGIILDRGPASLKFRWNIRGKEIENSSTKINGSGDPYYRFIGNRPTLDINGEYKVNDHATLYFSGRNVQNEPFNRYYYFDGKPHLFSSEDFGVQWSVGVKGKF